MKKGELLNSDISAVIAQMGHTETIAIGDCGLPIRNTKRIDIALKKGVPGLIETLEAVLCELTVERIILAEEIKEYSPEMNDEIISYFDKRVKIEYMSHEKFKKETENTKAVIRTGESTSYANVILVSGVDF